jgi:hypothetical protein
MATLDELLAAVQAETTEIASLTTFIQGLQSQIKGVSGLTPAQQAEIDQVFSDVVSNSAAIQAAMAAQVPASSPQKAPVKP